MSNIDNEIKFYLTQQGWYLGDKEIEIVDNINGISVVSDYLDTKFLAYYKNGKIFISKALATYASLPQRRLAILHEYAHSFLKINHLNPHEREYECDKWALTNMIESGLYTIGELMDGIRLFKDIIKEGHTKSHPSSQSRYKRLYSLLMESLR